MYVHRIRVLGARLIGGGSRRRLLLEVVLQGLNLNFGGLQRNAFGEIAFDVLEEGLQRRLGQLVEVHVPEVGADLVLHSMLLVDKDGFEQGHAVVVCLPLGPAERIAGGQLADGWTVSMPSHYVPLSNLDAQVISGCGGEPGVALQDGRVDSS